MGKFTGVMIVTDFDGTVHSSKTGMPARNVEAARRFMAEGGVYTIATGRTYATFAPNRGLIPTNAPVILSNGASTYDFVQDKMLQELCLPGTAREDLEILCQEMPTLAVEIYHDGKIFAFRPNEITDSHMNLVGASYTECYDFSIDYPWLKCLFHEEHEVLKRARERLQQLRPGAYETIFSNPKYLELTALGVNKGEAVKSLAKNLGISIEHVYTLGDNENDLPMLTCSALLAAPAGSAQVVLDLNPRLLCPCEEGALGDLVDILDGIY